MHGLPRCQSASADACPHHPAKRNPHSRRFDRSGQVDAGPFAYGRSTPGTRSGLERWVSACAQLQRTRRPERAAFAPAFAWRAGYELAAGVMIIVKSIMTLVRTPEGSHMIAGG